MGLVPFSKRIITGVTGSETRNLYKVGLMLPNQVGLKSINVAEIKEIRGPYEVLLGMNIIGMGDFTITKNEGKTVFSF